MKKTLRWSILLSLLLVCVMIPFMAQRASAEQMIVDGVQVSAENTSGSNWSYDSATKTLTLDNPTFDYDTNYLAVIYSEEQQLTVKGEANITPVGSDPSAGIAVTSSDQSIDLTLDNAKLTILVSRKGLDVGGKIIITGTDGAISVKGGQYGMYAQYGIEIEGGTVEAIGKTAAFNIAPDLTQYNGDYTVWVKDNAEEDEAKEWNSTTGKALSSYQYVKIVPAPKTYPLWIGSKQVTDANLTDILGDGTSSAKFEPSTNTLTLNNPAITGEHDGCGIYSALADGLTIAGKATVSGGKYGIFVEKGDLTITDTISGTSFDTDLNVTQTIEADYDKYYAGIMAEEGDLTISGKNTVVTVNAKSYGIRSRRKNIFISKARVEATGSLGSGFFVGIQAHLAMTIEEADVTATARDSILARSLTIRKSTVKAVTSVGGIYTSPFSGDLIIEGSKVTVESNPDGSASNSGISGSKVSVSDSEITITGNLWHGLQGYDALSVKGSTLNITTHHSGWAPSCVASDSGDITVYDCIITVKATAEYWKGYGLYSYSGNILISGENTVIMAEGSEAAISTKKGDITISAPLMILEPSCGTVAAGKIDGGEDCRAILKADGKTVAQRAVIKKFDPNADGLLYTVTWRNYNGAVLETDANVPYGVLPAYNGTTPYRPSTSAYIYTFSGWTPALAPVTGDVTYTANFTATPNLGPGGTIPGMPGTPGLPGMPGFTPGMPGGTTPGGTTPGGTTPGGTTPGGSTPGGSTPGDGTPGDGSTPGTEPGSTPGGETGLPFTDVTADSPYLEDIQYVYENDLMIGMSDTEFGEYLPLTRGMIVTVLWRMEGRPEVAYTGVFTDVPAGEWYTDGVEWAASHGIVLGYGNGKFGPNDNVTREQLAAILFRYANWKGYDTSVGEDTNILSYDDAFTWGDWAVSALQWACGTGVLEDVPVGMLRPTEPATRGEIAHAIRIFCEEVAK